MISKLKKLLVLVAAFSVTTVHAEWHASVEYGVAETVYFKLYNTDGTLDVDEVDGGAEVSLVCDGGAAATATNDFVDEGSQYSLALTAAELQCEVLAVEVAATDLNVFFVPTHGNASALVNNFPADTNLIEGTDATNAINTEADQAFTDYDPPTNTELNARTLATADYFDPAADPVANVTLVATTTTNTDMRGTDGANTTTPLSAAQVQQEAEDALVVNHLDHVFAVNYDPASPPGSATALFNELVEDDAGVSRFTVNALENGPSGSGASAAAIVDEWEAQSQADPTGFHVNVQEWLGVVPTALETATDIVDEWETQSLADPTGFRVNVMEVNGTAQTAGDIFGTFPTNFSSLVISAGGAADALTQGYLNSLMTESSVGRIAGNQQTFLDNADAATTSVLDDVGSGGGGSAPTVEQIRTEMDTNSTQLAAIAADTNELQTDDIPGAIAAQNDLSQAEVRAALGLASANLDTQLATIDGGIDNLEQAIILTTGTCDSGSTSTCVDAERTEGNDFWKGAGIRFTSGSLDGQTRCIYDFTSVSDTLTFRPTTAAASTNTYQIVYHPTCNGVVSP